MVGFGVVSGQHPHRPLSATTRVRTSIGSERSQHTFTFMPDSYALRTLRPPRFIPLNASRLNGSHRYLRKTATMTVGLPPPNIGESDASPIVLLYSACKKISVQNLVKS
jgi:hypothetical protein